MKNGKEKPALKLSGNILGDAAHRMNRKAAIKNLDKARELENTKRQEGWVWVKKEKTSKQVSPERLPELIAEGWMRK